MSEPAAADVRVIRRTWNRPQSKFLKLRAVPGGPCLYIDLEGAVGSGKTTAPAWKMMEYATAYPGIYQAVCAWTDEMLGPAKSAFLAAAREQGFSVDNGGLVWYGGQGEEYYEVVGFESRVYVRSLKASEDDMRYMKLAGLSLSVIWIDQPEPVPQDVFDTYIPARLRQPDYPHEVWLSPNPLDESHWLSKEFPTDPAKAKPHHTYIHVRLVDNVAHVGEQFIRDMELKHPPGSPLRHRFVDGTRGPMTRGTPIYGSVFKRAVHVRNVDPVEDHAIYDGWDFGQKHPACVFAQITWWGQLRILGSVEGDDIFIESFAPLVKEYRDAWFGATRRYEATCDPAGATGNAHGLTLNAVKVLNDHGVHPVFRPDFNHITRIDYAIQTIGGFLSREVVQPISVDDRCAYCEQQRPYGQAGDQLPLHLVVDGQSGRILHGRTVPAFVIDGRRHVVVSNLEVQDRSVLINGFASGYVHDERVPTGQTNLKRPLKDNIHDHTMRCVEYIVQQFWTPRPAGENLTDATIVEFRRVQDEQRAAERQAEIDAHDYDPMDHLYGKNPQHWRGRARVITAGPVQPSFSRGGW